MIGDRLQISRREVLRSIGGGLGGIALAAMLPEIGGLSLSAAEINAAATSRLPVGPLTPKAPHFAAKAKQIIFLFMNGGPSHVDTFDPKPGLEKYDGQDPPEAMTKKVVRKGKLMKSPFATINCGDSGIQISELFPEIAKRIDDLCIVRSMWADSPQHERALLFMNSGNIQPIRPSLGSWVTYGLGTVNQNLPGFVVMCPGKPVVGPQLWSNSFLPAVYQGTHINNSSLGKGSPVHYLTNSEISNDDQRRELDLLQQMNRMHREQSGPDSQLEARIESLEVAFRMQTEAAEAFDLSRESAKTREDYGSGEFADACLVARRLAERGVRITQIYYGNNQPWDDHKDILLHKDHASKSDKPIAAMLADLKQRGLLEETLVIWGGEFGRTPTAEGAKGRDHHANGFSMWLAGGGVKGGLAYGATDELGIEAVENRVHVHDLHATILHLLGMDHTKLTYRYSGRDFRLTDVSGNVLHEIIA
jgi:hypothetical protein